MTPTCFSRLGSLALRRGRNVAPPELSLPGPFVAAHYWTTLAAYLSVGEFEQGFPPGYGPARVGLDRSVWDRSHRFMTEPTTPAAHAVGKGEGHSSPSPLSHEGQFPRFTGVPLSGTGRPRSDCPRR